MNRKGKYSLFPYNQLVEELTYAFGFMIVNLRDKRKADLLSNL